MELTKKKIKEKIVRMKKKSPNSVITQKDFEDLDNILNKIRLYLNSKISIKDSIDGSVIIQTFSNSGIIKSEVKTKSIKNGIEFLINKIY